ncbi:MAG: fibronectin type III-like domain-contianing protein, partial [Clostridia bacterium]|nr:fibronectin type III-like domain-contianing protein [Clostridia bacterium]
PHFPFGFGLSYTAFELTCISCEKSEDKIKVTVKVTNKGEVDGDEVIQIYVGSNNKEIDRPVKLLKGFKRISVKAGESLSAEVDVLIDDIKFYNPENADWELDESYTVYVGTDSKSVTAAGKISF